MKIQNVSHQSNPEFFVHAIDNEENIFTKFSMALHLFFRKAMKSRKVMEVQSTSVCGTLSSFNYIPK